LAIKKKIGNGLWKNTIITGLQIDKKHTRPCKEINYEVIIKRPKTSVFIENKFIQLDFSYYGFTFRYYQYLKD